MDYIIANQHIIAMCSAIVGAFVVLDILTGLAQAVYTKTMKSEVMRKGLLHKCGIMLALVFGAMLNMAASYLELGVDIPAMQAIAAYIVLMEAKSIIENICIINPDLRQTLSRFLPFNGEVED